MTNTCVTLMDIVQPIPKSIQQIAEREAWETQPPNNAPDTEHPLQKWFLSKLTQREDMLESNPPLVLLGFEKSRKVIALKATTMQPVAAQNNASTGLPQTGLDVQRSINLASRHHPRLHVRHEEIQSPITINHSQGTR